VSATGATAATFVAPSPAIVRLPRGTPDPASRPYVPYGAVRELFRCRAREVLLEGPADTGKSMGCLNKLLLACLNYPNNRTAMVRKTRVSLTQSAMVTFEEKVLPRGAATFHAGDQQYVFANGSVCVTAGLDDPGKVLSTEFDFVYVQEADQLTLEDWETLLTRVSGRWGAMPYAQIVGDCNPTDPGHWLYQREAAGRLTVLTARHADNPTVTEERLAALKSLTGYRYRRLYLGERVAAEGMFFGEWDPAVHVVAPVGIPPHWPRWTATDYGYAAPFCTLFLARDPATRRVHATRELYAAGLRDVQQAELVAARIARERADLGLEAGGRLYALHVGDPSMFARRSEEDKPSIAAVYRARGVPLVPGLNNRHHGWQVVRDALAVGEDGPGLVVHRDRCPNLVRTLPAMVHDPLDPEDLADAVKGAKTEDHAVDALRYGLCAEAAPRRGASRPVEWG